MKVLIASVNIQTSYTTIAEIAKTIGGDKVEVNALANPHYDPHFIVPKPSLIAKLRRADLLIINGAGLEIGWMPSLLKSANNGKIRSGSSGFLDISHAVNLINQPTNVSRAFGDVHAQGNPHYILDPHLVVNIADAIAQRLSRIDPKNATTYTQNLEHFSKQWNVYLTHLDAKMAKCTDKKVIQYHQLFNYYLGAYGYDNYGTIEPLPGITPSSKHTIDLINTINTQKIKRILQDVYHEQKTAAFIAGKTEAKVIILPHDVGAVDEADTLENFYNVIAQRLCQ